ncbi:MAG: leucyl aminopeptidase [Cytophagales bacterium]|nr:leucyl aminopeptidase [Rhizobacter sp.]
MDFRHQISLPGALSTLPADALLLVLAGEAVDAALDAKLAAPLNDALAQGDFKLKAGRHLYLHRLTGVKAPRVLASAAPGSGVKAFKAAVLHGLNHLKGLGAKHVAVAFVGGELDEQHAEAVVTAAAEATYLYRHTKPSAAPDSTLAKLTLVCDKAQAKAVQAGLVRGQAVSAGVTLARELANRPGNHCTPSYVAEQARKLGKEHGLKVEVLDRKDVEKLGMGAFLAVTQGSHEPPRFIVARYNGAAKTQAPVVLVGKGITFDSGGISIKPAGEMDEMKFDMGGAASVLGTLRAVAELKPKLNLVVIVPTCENMPDGRAMKPGDVVTSMSGQTIEILNTDAEGRLILCDALTYAERFKPSVVVDVATLTGACIVALGHHHSGLFSPDDALAGELLAASQAALDPLWRMPLDDEYAEGLKSNFADMGNVGPRAGGAITAAIFLKKFTAKYRWAHIDIAGTAWKSGAAKGSTGRPVPLLTHFVLSQAV